jgi:hypothetical protein
MNDVSQQSMADKMIRFFTMVPERQEHEIRRDERVLRAFKFLFVAQCIGQFYFLYLASPSDYPGWWLMTVNYLYDHMPSVHYWTQRTYHLREEMPSLYTLSIFTGMPVLIIAAIWHSGAQPFERGSDKKIGGLHVIFKIVLGLMITWFAIFFLFTWQGGAQSDQPDLSSMRFGLIGEVRMVNLFMFPAIFMTLYYLLGLVLAWVRRTIAYNIRY